MLNELDAEAIVLLQQVELHKRMNRKKMERVFDMSTEELDEILRPLRLNSLVTEKAEEYT